MRRPLKTAEVAQPFGGQNVDYSQFGLVGHHGVDYVAGVGTPVYAPEDGQIQFSADGVKDPYTGRMAAGETLVLIGTYEHWLLHLSQRLVSATQFVKEGSLIGYSGATGFVTGAHLHWGVRPLRPDLNNGYRGFIDPALVLNVTTNGGEMVTDRLQLDRMYHAVLERNRGFGEGEDVYLGKDSGFVFNDLVMSAERARMLEAKQRMISDMNQKIADLQAALSTTKPPEVVIKEVEKIVYKDTPINEQEVVQGFLVRLWNGLFKK